jgi:hypothetical protein
MAQWHLDELRGALERRGWRVTAELPGDDYKISGTWELRRSGDPCILLIDFDGLDDMRVLPLHRRYACRTRSTEHSLYFHRRREAGSQPCAHWRQKLSRFIEAISERTAV